MSDNCFEITGAASAGLPGLTIGEQIGGMWKSIAVTKQYHALALNVQIWIRVGNYQRLYAVGGGKPIQPSSADSVVGVMTSILMAANMVCTQTKDIKSMTNNYKERTIHTLFSRYYVRTL